MPEKSPCKITAISPTLQAAYDEQYDDRMTEWRKIGAKYKSQNILNVCDGATFGKVLECGAGEGSILHFLNETDFAKELHATEISESAIAQIKKRQIEKLRSVIKFDGYSLPYEDNEFDLAYCSHVIEHVEHPRLLLRELKRVSQRQVFEVPLDYYAGADAGFKGLMAYGHINMYTPTTFRFLLKTEGFEILNELHTHIPEEVERFNLYRNLGVEKSFRTEWNLKKKRFKTLLKQLKSSRRMYMEFQHSAYTCLTKGTGDIQIFAKE